MLYDNNNNNNILNGLKQYPDLYKYSTIRSIVRLTAAVLWYSFWFFVYYKYFILLHKSLFRGDPTSKISVIIIVTIILLFPFLVFKVHKLITDKSYHGIIKQIRKAYKIKPFIVGANYRENYKERECIIFIVEDSSGKIHEYTYFEKNEIDNLVYYKTGSHVIHYKEIKYLYNKDLKKEKMFCIICCNIISDKDAICPRCKHSLIRDI